MAEFAPAIAVVLENEGGYSNNSADAGGETNFGLSKLRYPDLDIKNLTKEEAEAIYLRDWWKFGGLLDQNVANKLFDSFVNMSSEAIRIMQRCVGVIVDGSYGPKTEEAINRIADPATLLEQYRGELVVFYEDLVQKRPENAKFLEGWLRRARQ
jgi:lysozyme family protein